MTEFSLTYLLSKLITPLAWLWDKAARPRAWLRAKTASPRARAAHGFTQLFIAIDQLLNVLSNPFSDQTWADETLSSRCGRLGHRYPYKFWKVVIDNLLFSWWQGPDHCVKANIKETARYNSPPSQRIPPAP